MPSTSPSSGPFQNFQAITPQFPRAKNHSQPKLISITRPELNAFAFSHKENIHPHTQPTTHLTFQPKLLPLTPPRLCLTHGLYQAIFAASWDTLYSYSRLDPTSGSSPGCQSRIQSWIQLCAGVRKRFLPPQHLHTLIFVAVQPAPRIG